MKINRQIKLTPAQRREIERQRRAQRVARKAADHRRVSV